MINVQRVIEEMSNFDNRHLTLKGLFIRFQGHLQLLCQPEFSVRGITVHSIDGELSRIQYIGREYEIRFSSTFNQTALVGVISFGRVVKEMGITTFQECSRVTFNGQSEVAIDPPAGEDSIHLERDSDSLVLVLNMIRDEIYS